MTVTSSGPVGGFDGSDVMIRGRINNGGSAGDVGGVEEGEMEEREVIEEKGEKQEVKEKQGEDEEEVLWKDEERQVSRVVVPEFCSAFMVYINEGKAKRLSGMESNTGTNTSTAC